MAKDIISDILDTDNKAASTNDGDKVVIGNKSKQRLAKLKKCKGLVRPVELDNDSLIDKAMVDEGKGDAEKAKQRSERNFRVNTANTLYNAKEIKESGKRGEKIVGEPRESIKGVHEPLSTNGMKGKSVAGFLHRSGKPTTDIHHEKVTELKELKNKDRSGMKKSEVIEKLKALKHKDRSGLGKTEERFKGHIPSVTGNPTYDDKNNTKGDLKDKKGDRYQGIASTPDRPGPAPKDPETVKRQAEASARNEAKTKVKHIINEEKKPKEKERKNKIFPNKESPEDKQRRLSRMAKLTKSEAIEFLNNIIKSEESKGSAEYGSVKPHLDHIEMAGLDKYTHSGLESKHKQHAAVAAAKGDEALAEKHAKMAKMHDRYFSGINSHHSAIHEAKKLHEELSKEE